MVTTVATTAADVAAIAAAWDALPVASPHADRTLFTLVSETSAAGARPHVVLIDAAGTDPILVVARVERRPVRVRVGYRTLFAAPARWLVVVAGGVVGADTPAAADRVIKALRGELRAGVADVLELSKVDPEHPVHAAAARGLGWYRRGHGSPVYLRHRSDLSRGFDAFLAGRSKGTRWRVRKRLRMLTEPASTAGKLTVRQVGPGDDVEAVVRALDTITTKSYQRGIGVGFVDDALHRGLLAWALADGAYRVWTLYVDDTPAAFVNGVLHGRTFYLFETAFDPTVPVEEPGSVLLARVLEDLADEPGVDAFDYGFGDAQYKRSFSDTATDAVDIVGFAVRPRALALNLLNTTAALAVSGVKRALGPQRLERLRRRRRAAAAGGTDAAAAGGTDA